MSLMRSLLLILLCCLVLHELPVFAAGHTYSAIRSDYRRLLESSQLQRQRDNWEEILQSLDVFIRDNPQHEDIDKAFYLHAKVMDGLSRASGSDADARAAIEQYLHMSDRFPTSNLADDALFNAGQLAEKILHDQSAARRYYQRIVDRFTTGDMVADALKGLNRLPQPQQPAVKKAPPVRLAAVTGSLPATLQQLRYWSGPEYTRVVLDLSAAVQTEPHLLKGAQPRIYFDLPKATLAASLPQKIGIRNGLIEQVRISQYDEDTVRVVLDLERLAEYRLTNLVEPDRIVVDVLGKSRQVPTISGESGQAGAVAKDDSIANILTSVPTEPTLRVPQQSKEEGIRLIVVDAGHGGKDPGAIGPHNTHEKSVTLQMAKALTRRLRKELGVKVLMTRSDDRFIELHERTAYANRVGADLFISLHANANRNGKAYGVETYFLNLSKNDQAAAVAARENGTSLQDVTNLEAILFDLMANAKINESSRLAAEVQQALIAGLRPHYSHVKDLGVRQGPFHVLLGATMPSVLVEAAFISNKREEKRLKSNDYQERVAASIVRGVKDYMAAIDQVARR